MQEIILFSIVGLAVVYLIFKLMPKNNAHNCDDCGLSEKEKSKA